jgi:hypothetical protein
VVGIAGRDCNWVAAVESGEEKEEEILVYGDGDAGAVGFFVIMGGGFFIKVAVSLQWGIWRDTVCFCVCRCNCYLRRRSLSPLEIDATNPNHVILSLILSFFLSFFLQIAV